MFKSSVVSLLVPHICYIALHHTPHENINRCYKKVKSKVRANSVSVAHPSSANSEMPRIVNYFQRLWPCVKLWSVLSSLLYVFHLIFFRSCSTWLLFCCCAYFQPLSFIHLLPFHHFHGCGVEVEQIPASVRPGCGTDWTLPWSITGRDEQPFTLTFKHFIPNVPVTSILHV